jgi:hypothetical protein
LTGVALVVDGAKFAALFTGVAAGFVIPAGFEAWEMVFLTGVFDTVLAGVVVVFAGVVAAFAAGAIVFFGVTVLVDAVVGFDTELTAAFAAGALLTGVAVGFEVVPVGVVFLTAGFDAEGAVIGFFAGVEAAGVEVPAVFSFRGTRLTGVAAAFAVPEAAPATFFTGVGFAVDDVVFAIGFFAAGWLPATLDTLSTLAECICKYSEHSRKLVYLHWSAALWVLRSSTTDILGAM